MQDSQQFAMQHLLTGQSVRIINDLKVSNRTMSSEPKYQRRKDERPGEITAAAFEVFAEKGYAAARVDDVARRAGISKGLTYLYFKTKEELFKAVVRSVVMRRVDALTEHIARTELSTEAFLRGPMLEFMKSVPDSPVAIVVRLLIAEGPRHPDLTEFYYANVVAKGVEALSGLLRRGVERGELKPEALHCQPQLLLAPVMLSVIWRALFGARDLDTDRLMETQIDLLLARIAV